MIFSKRHGFIFFAAGKTGTTSIERILQEYADPPPEALQRAGHKKHAPPRAVKALLDEATWNGMFKFAFVRNPWDWVVSNYYFNLTDHEKFPRRQLRWLGWIRTPATFTEKEFAQHWETMKRYTRGTHPENRFQYSFLADETGTLLVDTVGRFESLQRDFDAICGRIGIPRVDLQHANPAEYRRRRSYTELYTDASRKLVAEHYAKDIERFGYRFGE